MAPLRKQQQKSSRDARSKTPGCETIPASFFYPHAGKEKAALLTRDGAKMVEKTRGEFEKDVRELAMGLISLGIGPGERVAILLENGPEWIISDLAIAAAGAVSVPVYTTLGKEEMLSLLKDSLPSAIIFSDAHRARVFEIKTELASLRRLVSTGGEGEGISTLDGVKALGRESGNEDLMAERIKGISGSAPFSIIYSSGTTGRAKGVVLSHKNILSNISSVLGLLPVAKDDIYLSYLPLSHVFERMMHHLFVYRGSAVAYSKGFASVGADMGFFRPSIMTGVPFFFERMKDKILSTLGDRGAAEPGGHSGERIREAAFPGVKFFISGGAALHKATAQFFLNLGLKVLQGYGLTETSPVVTVNTLEANKPGTVGRAVPGVKVKTNAEGEILVKGPNVMKGYHNMPGATKEALKDGWLHTGDIGFIDRDGFLTITGRKKDLIITSLGKNIPPQKIETLLKADEYIKEALIYGDGRPHLVALIVPEAERMEGLAKELGMEGMEMETLLADKAVHDFFEGRIHARLKGLARFEQIRRFALIRDSLSLE
ncbi:MAG: long-chain fatty acid--CoA ligase, partial [Deltaproteobacteria bacterium]|nr:long-chain fatty acid--CoA ligase [Deltaproteobacteria bacterium]